MNKRVMRIAALCVLGFTIGTASAWYEVNKNSGAAALARLEPAAGSALAGASIGGDFSLTDHNGKPVTAQDYEGSYKLVFFGFTSCPDVCPAGLKRIAAVMDALGPKASMVQPLFITVDPGRDTPEAMKAFVEMFHPRITGLTGTAEQLAVVEKAYKVYAAKIDDPALTDYTINHSAYTYFMGPNDEPLTLFSDKDTPAAMTEEILKVMPDAS